MKIQSIIRVAIGKYEVKVFLNEGDDFEYQQLGFTDLEMLIRRYEDLPMVELTRRILDNPKVAAVEIISWDKNGVRVER